MLISVITPTLDSAAALPTALQSILEAILPTGTTIEHIIVDGGSTDNTLSVVEQTRHRYEAAGLTLRIVTGHDCGIYDAINKGIKASSGDIIGILHSDDMLSGQDGLLRVASAFEADSDLEAVYADACYVSRNDISRVTRRCSAALFKPRRMLMGFQPPHPTVYCRRRVYERYGLYDPRYAIAGDFDFMLRAIYHGRIQTLYLPITLVTMRDGGRSNRSVGAHLRGLWEHQLAYIRQRVPSCIILDVAQLIHKITQVQFS